MKSKESMRLARYLAQAGIGSRRSNEKLITDGLVTVNGEVITKVGTVIDPSKDKVLYKRKLVEVEELVYYILHKPIGYVCSLSDKHNDKLVTKLIDDSKRIYPVGRLDKDSSGLLILTNDGDLTLKLSHPRYMKSKVYEVTVDKAVTTTFERCMREGIRLSEGVAKVDNLKVHGSRKMEVTIHQGWKRQVRRMVEHCGLHVVTLKRIAEGGVQLGDLPVGKYKRVKLENML